nr:hypothetical protein BaRGS_006858 [Batillaria attramentaria]
MMQKMIDDQASKILLGTQQQIQAVQSEIAQVNTFVQSLSQDFADIKVRTTALEEASEETAGLKEEIHAADEKLGRIVDHLEEKIDKLEAYSRRENLTMFAIPEAENENCMRKVLQALQTAIPDKDWCQRSWKLIPRSLLV